MCKRRNRKYFLIVFAIYILLLTTASLAQAADGDRFVTRERKSSNIPTTAFKATASDLYLDSTNNFIWDGAQWVDTLRFKYVYSTDGNKEYASKQLWESDQWNYEWNFAYKYDEFGRVIENIMQDFDVPDLPAFDTIDFIIKRKFFSYNPDGTLADSMLQYWNSFFDKWDETGKERWSYLYDGSGNQVQYLHELAQWHNTDPFWQWQNDSKAISTYDIGNNLTEFIEQWWDIGGEQWIDASKYTFTYDGGINMIDSTSYYWEDDLWHEAMKTTFTYDHNDNMIEELEQYEEESQWVNSWKFTYDYDSHSNEIGKLEQYWDYDVWENSWKDASTYDANNNITENIGQFWNWSIKQWIVFDRHTATYDIYGNQTEYIAELWDNSQWNNDQRKINYYSELTVIETGVGSDVEIILDDGIIILFDSVDVAGNTIITQNEVGPEAEKYDLLPDNDYIYVTVDAEYVGGIEICIPYDHVTLSAAQEDLLRVIHYTDGQWVDITSSHDKENDIICGTTVDLSPFTLGLIKQPTDIEVIDDKILPKDFILSQNYPNPFNPSTIIQFSLPRLSKVKIDVYNILGQSVRHLVNEEKPAGQYQVIWNGLDNNGKSVSSGIYFYKIKTEDFSSSKKMLLLK